MADLIPGVGEIDWFNIAGIGQIMYYVGIFFMAVIILAVFVAAYYTMQFRIKATVIPLYGSGKDNIFSFGKPRRNKVKWINKKTAWKSLWPLFNKVERQPFSSEYIYPGNNIWVYELENEWMPGRQNVSVELKELEGEEKEQIEGEVCKWLNNNHPSNPKWIAGDINVNITEEQIRSKINPVPFHTRNWQSLTYRKHEIEFAKQDFWSANKQLIFTLAVIFFICAMVVGVIYFTFQFAGGAKDSMDLLSRSIQGMQNIPAAGGVIPK